MNDEIIKLVEQIVCESLNITPHQLHCRNRIKQFVFARHLFAYIMRKHYNFTFIEIAKYLKKHHATVMHSVKDTQNFVSINDYKTCNALKLIYENSKTIDTINGFSFVTLKIDVNLIYKYGRDNLIDKINEFIKEI
jgi:hypothetical protein